MIVEHSASRKPWVIFTLIFGSLTALTIRAAVTGRPSFWPAVGIFGSVYAFVAIWLSWFRITISDSAITFRSLGAGSKSLPLEEIRRVELKFEVGNGTQGPMRLKIKPRHSSVHEALDINAQVFHADAIQAVLELGKRLARVETNGLEKGVVARHRRKRRDDGAG